MFSSYKEKIRHKWFILFICFLGFFITLYFFISKRNRASQDTESVSITPPNYFVPVTISEFSVGETPCINVQIEDKTFSMTLDLGLRGDLSIKSQFLEQLSNKTFLGNSPMYGIRGQKHLTNFYRIPKIKIGTTGFIKPTLQEESEEAQREGIVVQNGEAPSLSEPGKLGWELFRSVNLFLDVKHSKIAFCDSLETLKKQGYPTENFTKTSLLVERGLVEIMVNTEKGSLRCMLDTGATWNVINTEIEEKKSLEQIIWDSDNLPIQCPSFKIGEKEFGPIEFYCIPIKFPIHVEAILGIEFFSNHLVFIDFRKNQIYFLKE